MNNTKENDLAVEILNQIDQELTNIFSAYENTEALKKEVIKQLVDIDYQKKMILVDEAYALLVDKLFSVLEDLVAFKELVHLNTFRGLEVEKHERSRICILTGKVYSWIIFLTVSPQLVGL